MKVIKKLMIKIAARNPKYSSTYLKKLFITFYVLMLLLLPIPNS